MTTPFIGTVEVEDSKSQLSTVTLDGDKASVSVGCLGTAKGVLPIFPGHDGNLAVLAANGFTRCSVDPGTIRLTNDVGKLDCYLGGGQLNLGGNGSPAVVNLYPPNALNNKGDVPQAPTISLHALEATINAGGNQTDGQLGLFPAACEQKDFAQATIHLRAKDGTLRLGGGGVGVFGFPAVGADGRILILDKGGNGRILLEGGIGYGAFGGNGYSGGLALFPGTATKQDDWSLATITLNGDTGNLSLKGDVFLTSADCAEDFDIAGLLSVDPGTVMVIDEDGALRQSETAYDRKVAGVLSGAGNYKPGIILDKREPQGKRLPVALLGKVYCKVDASYAPVEVGDLLATSATPGHAMKAGDPLKAFGAVLGKALNPLASGRGLIPILVSLQ